MTTHDLKLNYDGICIYATTILKAAIVGRLFLLILNLVLIGVIIAFSIEKVFIGVLVFTAVEIFIIKYSLWNLYGEERLIINAKSLSYQHYYGLFTTPFHTISFNKRIQVLPYGEVVEGDQTYVKFLFESYNENNLPSIIYHSVLHINKTDFEKLLQYIDQLFVDEMSESYEMPRIYMN